MIDLNDANLLINRTYYISTVDYLDETAIAGHRRRA